MLPPPPRSTLFPYTTLFRSGLVLATQEPGNVTGQTTSSSFGLRLEISRQLGQPLDVLGIRLKSKAQPENQPLPPQSRFALRSEEHTSELQSHSDLVCRLLLE